MQEIWREIAGYEGKYQISNLGRVKSLKRKKPRILVARPFKQGSGYLGVSLFPKGKVEVRLVHRLVAETFIPNPERKPQVNHINGIKTDNRVENLEWATAHENILHAHATGLAQSGENHVEAKLKNEQVLYIRNNPDKLTPKELGTMFDVTRRTVSYVQLGQRYRAAGGNIRIAPPKVSHVPDNVRAEIRRLYVKGSHEFGCHGLAKRFGVNPTTVCRILKEQ